MKFSKRLIALDIFTLDHLIISSVLHHSTWGLCFLTFETW